MNCNLKIAIAIIRFWNFSQELLLHELQLGIAINFFGIASIGMSYELQRIFCRQGWVLGTGVPDKSFPQKNVPPEMAQEERKKALKIYFGSTYKY